MEILIDDLTSAAHEAIEQAAAESARAASIALLEQEAKALAVQATLRFEAERWKNETAAAKKAGVWNAIITGVVCFFGGLVIGIVIR